MLNLATLLLAVFIIVFGLVDYRTICVCMLLTLVDYRFGVGAVGLLFIHLGMIVLEDMSSE